MVTAADYPFLDVLGTMLIFFAWVIWFWLLIRVFGDVFRRHDLSGWGKAGRQRGHEGVDPEARRAAGRLQPGRAPGDRRLPARDGGVRTGDAAGSCGAGLVG